MVGVGKHLCGAATDLSMRCLAQVLPSLPQPHPEASPLASPDPLKAEKPVHCGGLGFALCCHHRCDWGPYVGKAFLRSLGFTKAPTKTNITLMITPQLEPTDIRSSDPNLSSSTAPRYFPSPSSPQAEFKTLARISSWAVCGQRKKEDDKGEAQGEAAAAHEPVPEVRRGRA